MRLGSQKQVLRSVFPHGLFQCLVSLLVCLLLLSTGSCSSSSSLTILTSAMASSSLLLLRSSLLLLLLEDSTRALFIFAGAFLAGDSFSLLFTDLSFLLFSLLDTSSLSLRLGTLTSRCRCAADDAADVDLDDGSLLLSLTLRIGEGDSRRRLSGESAAGVAARGHLDDDVEDPADSPFPRVSRLLHLGPHCIRVGLTAQELSWVESCFH